MSRVALIAAFVAVTGCSRGATRGGMAGAGSAMSSQSTVVLATAAISGTAMRSARIGGRNYVAGCSSGPTVDGGGGSDGGMAAIMGEV